MDFTLIKQLQEEFITRDHETVTPTPEVGLKHIHDVIKIQGGQGNWNYDPYMHGLYNGLIVAKACMTGGEANDLRKAPEEWLADKCKEGISVEVPDGYHKHPLLKKAFEAKRTGKEIFDDMEHDHLGA